MQYIVSDSEHKVLNAVRAHVARDAQAKQAQDVLRQADENAAFWASVARVERAGLLTAVVYVGALRTLVVLRRDASAEEIQQAIQAVVGTAGTVTVTPEEIAPRSVTVTGQHEYEEIPNPLDGLDWTNDIPGETHLSTPGYLLYGDGTGPVERMVPGTLLGPKPDREMTIADWLYEPRVVLPHGEHATTVVFDSAVSKGKSTLEDVVAGTSTRGPNPGSIGHKGRTVPAGERSTTPWDGTRLADAMGERRLDRFDVADALCVTRRSVGYWLTNTYSPAEKHRAALRALLGAEV